VLPAFSGFLIAATFDFEKERNVTAVLLGPSLTYEMRYLDWKDGNRASSKLNGTILAEAGLFFLIMTEDGPKVLKKNDIISMRRPKDAVSR